MYRIWHSDNLPNASYRIFRILYWRTRNNRWILPVIILHCLKRYAAYPTRTDIPNATTSVTLIFPNRNNQPPKHWHKKNLSRSGTWRFRRNVHHSFSHETFFFSPVIRVRLMRYYHHNQREPVYRWWRGGYGWNTEERRMNFLPMWSSCPKHSHYWINIKMTIGRHSYLPNIIAPCVATWKYFVYWQESNPTSSIMPEGTPSQA